MKQLTKVAVTLLALATATPVLVATTSPSAAQGWRDSDDESRDSSMRDAFLDRLRLRRDLRELLEDRVRTRADLRDLIEDRMSGRRGLRERLRERMQDRMAAAHDDDDDDGDGGGGGLRGRLRERIAQWRHGREGDCYFFTRTLRDADGDFLIIARRRICRD